MFKKVQLFLLGLIAASCMMAQSSPKSVTINQSDIQYWVGNGTNSTVIAIGWDDEDASYTPTVVVWGIHWSGNITLLDALDSLMAYDSRFSYTFNGSYLNGVYYNDASNGVNLTPSMGFNCNNYNGVYGSTYLNSTWLRISESTCNNYNFTGINNLIYASNPNNSGSLPDTVDAALPFNEILYWVGSGSDSAEFIVNYAQPDTAFAWGYLFNGSTTALDMINAIAAADPRFWIEGTPSINGDIHFVTNDGDTLGLSPVDPTVGYNFWWTNLNGVSVGSGTASTLHNGDVFKFGDLNSATGWDALGTYFMEEAWNTIPTPVPVPSSTPDVPEEATIAASEILYWVGTGSNEAILAVNWADTCLAWGYRFNGTKTVANMMDDIAAADPRFSYSGTGFLNDITFYDGVHSFAGVPGNYWGSTNNSVMDAGLGQTLSNGDFEKWGDPAAGTVVDSNNYGGDTWYYTYVYTMTVNPVSVPTTTPDVPEDASIAATDILYWVGTGSNEVVLAINWADTALAWGYRFNGEKSVADMMSDIAAADQRFSYTTSGSMLTDINFNTGNSTLGIAAGNYWWSLLNHESGMGMIDDLEDGDFYKWGDLSVAVIADSTWVPDWGGYWDYTYVWPYTIHPVSIPSTTPDVPEDASIAATDILYWVGTGSNEVVLAVNWADTALAWGYRFNGEKSVADMMSDIAAADPRFSYTTSGSMLSDINFTAGNRTLGIAAGNYWWSLLNHESGMGMIDDLEDGDFFKWGDLSVAVIADSTWVEDWGGYWDYAYVWPMTIHPVSVPSTTPEVLEDASIEASAIEYWVGNGNNKVILAVNWADTVLAWGYRFNGEKTVADMMTDIASADPRFSYTTSGSMLSDINFTAGNRTFGIAAGNYWWSLLNHEGGMGMIDDLENGDFYKWGDLSVAVIADSTWVEDWGGYWDYAYVWPYTIHAVSQPDGMGPFCNKVGTEGCTAVKFDDSRIKAWATACTVVRGSQNLSNPNAPLVTYGTEDEAVGAASASTMDVVSLGDGGTATLTFANPITNGEGYDFAVFENSFDDYFLELAFVEVSSDGQRFVRFPATSLSQTARQIVSKVDPTYINNLAGKYKVGYGTPFDLNELRDSTGIDINNITHVRIVDVVGSIDPQYGTYDAFGHIVNDPFPTNSYSSGFDLDGIAVMHQKGNGIDEAESTSVSIYPNPASEKINITVNEDMDAQLFDMSGRCIMTINLHNGINSISLDGISNGVYLLRTPAGVQKIVKK